MVSGIVKDNNPNSVALHQISVKYEFLLSTTITFDIPFFLDNETAMSLLFIWQLFARMLFFANKSQETAP